MFVRNGEKLGSLLVDKHTSASSEPAEPKQSEPTHPDRRTDGVHAVGGGWHEVVVDGEVIDKIRGADAAREAYESLTEPTREVHDGGDAVSA